MLNSLELLRLCSLVLLEKTYASNGAIRKLGLDFISGR
jgi:hypothetical protein